MWVQAAVAVLALVAGIVAMVVRKVGQPCSLWVRHA